MEKKYLLSYPTEEVNKPIVYQLIKKFDLKLNILKAELHPGKESKLLISVNAGATEINQGLDYLSLANISWMPVEHTIAFQEESCVHCGSCTGVCLSGALLLDSRSRKISFNPEKCIACKMCVKACPLQLFEINFYKT
jgi:ferredoxin